jgi:methylated-DNA-[protein]-cysteine S-methyltransferase
VAVIWTVLPSGPRAVRIFLSKPGLTADELAASFYPEAGRHSTPQIESIAEGIVAFLKGAAIRFSLDTVRMDLCSDLQRRVLRAEHAVPRGRVTTYGRLAACLRIPKGARAVSRCLARNPFPIIIPCHRAIRSDRSLGGYQGGIEMKRALLEMEGIRFDTSGRAEAKEFFY